MNHLLMTTRVRPARVVVLLDRSANPIEFVRVTRFFSQIWGGRFSLILPVDVEVADSLSLFRLRELRPEFVYGVGINESKWGPAIYKACQPRQFCLLRSNIADDVSQAHHEGFIRGDQAVVAMFNARNVRSRFTRPLTVVAADKTSLLSPYCAVMFGVHHPDLADEYRDEGREFDSNAAEHFIDLCMDFAKHNKQTWLDATSFNLSSHHMSSPSVEPTIVLVDDIVADLSLFWNLRIVNDHDSPSWIIPVPAAQVDRQEVVDSLSHWLEQFNPIANYCVITSESVSEADCMGLIDRISRAMDGKSIRYVDYERSRNRLPLVIPFESCETWPAKLDGRKLELVPPTPQVFKTTSSSTKWYVDLVNDAGSSRALLDMQLPSSTIIPEILNGSCPPKFDRSKIKQFADGVDSINCRCSSGESIVRFYVPTPDEVLEELMIEGGFEILHDEKRNSYIPTIDRFGSIYEAAKAFSGKSGEILNALLEGGTLLPVEIRGLCKLGGGDLPIDDYLGRITNMSRRDTERTKRIVKQRYEEFARGEIPESLTLGALLEHWADRSILVRNWKLGPCPQCRQSWFVKELRIQQPILCSNCGRRLSLPERLPIGYSLSPTVKHSLNEGLVPVALAGRFLRNMTNRGFFWLPGVKHQKGDVCGDVDILACCDGHVVFAECKTLAKVKDDAGVWSAVVKQFLEATDVAIKCNATLAVLASRVENYPDCVEQQIQESLRDRIRFLLLNGTDLEAGHREEDGRWVSISDFAPREFPEATTKRDGIRTIDFGVMTYTKGS